MMLACLLIYLTSAYPLWLAWRRNRATSLQQALIWMVLAWLAWGAVLILAVIWNVEDLAVPRYLALCLTGCAGVAVLGARQPGAGAWNFVVLALLAVLSWPVVEAWFVRSGWQLGTLPAIFLIGTLAVSGLNYLPTRLVLMTLCLSVGFGLEFPALFDPARSTPWTFAGVPLNWFALGVAPWLGYGLLRWRAPPAQEVDRLWLDFRDRYGLMWGQRLREQFNRSAVNAGWPVELGWFGLRRVEETAPAPDTARELTTLQALMKRFGTT